MEEEKEFLGTILNGRIIGDSNPDKAGIIHRLFTKGLTDLYIGKETGKIYQYGITKNPDVIVANRLAKEGD
jgi:hypothetical protein